MIDIVKELVACRFKDTPLPFYPEKIEGYTLEEIDLIAQRYNLNIHGQFKDFLLQIGKCSGGLLTGSMFPMYNPSWSKDRLANYQKILKNNDNYQFYSDPSESDPVESKLFLLAIDNEGMYEYYLFTAYDHDTVWMLDESFCDFGKTKWDLLGILKYYVEDSTKGAWLHLDPDTTDWKRVEASIKSEMNGHLL